MDMIENNKFELEKNHGDHLSDHSSGTSANWQVSAMAMSVVPGSTSLAAGLVTPVTSSPYPSAPMMEPFAPVLWNHHANSPTMGLGESNITSSTSATNCIPIGKPVAVCSRGMLVSAVPGISPPSLPHFPADLAFIERAARLSCFSDGNFGGLDFFGPVQSVAPLINDMKDGTGFQPQKTETNTSVDKVVLLPVNHASINRSPVKNQRDHLSCESNFTEGGQDGNTDSADAAGNASTTDIGANKRRRTIEDVEKDQVQRGLQSSSETTKENTEYKRKVDQNNSKHSGKNGKDNSEAAKEDYVHMRARRGQATNSHSLAERVRREKISERMKCLQELVPGCSKVTGKAVMLDEIINYVQSLQRQVEFLSMKLAAVNPQLDFSIEGLLAKNGLVHAGTSAMVNPSDTFRRAMNTQLPTTSGYKESSLQAHNPWNEELMMQMTYDATPQNAQEMNTKTVASPYKTTTPTEFLC